MSCPKCGSELEENPEDSSKWYCEKCNYDWSLKTIWFGGLSNREKKESD